MGSGSSCVCVLGGGGGVGGGDDLYIFTIENGDFKEIWKYYLHRENFIR